MKSRGRRMVSRRAVLRGAGVALALPWLESWPRREARAQAPGLPVRFLPIFLPNGAHDFWKPQAVGSGLGWQLSSVLQPLEVLKSQTTVISGLENGSVFNEDGSAVVDPAHGRQAGAWLTCADAAAVSDELGVEDANGVSVDQIVATDPYYADLAPIPSLQVGLSSFSSPCDGRPCSLTRSVSWRTPTTPLYKTVDPKLLFQELVSANANVADDPEVARRLRNNKSVLDAVLESAAVVQPKLSVADQQRLDQFLTSVRSVEKRVTLPIGRAACELPEAPVFPDVGDGVEYQQNTEEYDKGLHADLMNDLIALAFQCDLTRVVSYMLEDENSDFVYDHVPLRTFSATGSIEAAGSCGSYRGAHHQGGAGDEFATISWWNVMKVAELCSKLAMIEDSDGSTALDNTVVFLGGCMHGSNHLCADLPSLLIGGGGRLRTDQHLAFENRPLRDLYYTLLTNVFQLGVDDFGVNRTGAPVSVISELLV